MLHVLDDHMVMWPDYKICLKRNVMLVYLADLVHVE